MPDFLNNLVLSQAFPLFAIFWLVVCFLSPQARALAERGINLLNKPHIFTVNKGEERNRVLYYPRELFEGLANALREFLVNPPTRISETIRGGIDNLWSKVHNPSKPMLTFGYAFFFVVLIAFLYADTVVAISTLDALHLLSIDLSGLPWLTNYDVATLLGTLIAIIIGTLVFSQIHSPVSNISDWDEVSGAWKNIATSIAIFLILSGLAVVVSLGLARLVAEGTLSENSSLTFLTKASIYVLIPLNVVLATVLLHLEGFKGIILVCILFLSLILVLVQVVRFVSRIVGNVLPVISDFVYRIVFFLLDVLFFIFLTPFQVVLSVITYPFRAAKSSDSTTGVASAVVKEPKGKG